MGWVWAGGHRGRNPPYIPPRESRGHEPPCLVPPRHTPPWRIPPWGEPHRQCVPPRRQDPHRSVPPWGDPSRSIPSWRVPPRRIPHRGCVPPWLEPPRWDPSLVDPSLVDPCARGWGGVALGRGAKGLITGERQAGLRVCQEFLCGPC